MKLKQPLRQSKVIFNEEEHTYKLGKAYLSGITGIISKYIFPDKYKGIPDSVLMNAAEKGRAIHKDIENYEEGLPYCLIETKAYISLMAENGISHLASEYIVSDNKRYASAIDKVDDQYNLYDIKTTYTLDEDYISWQLSIYAYLFELQNGFPCNSLFAIWIKGSNAKLIPIKKIDGEIIKEFLDAAYNETIWFNPLEKSLSNVESALQRAVEFETFIHDLEEQKKLLEESYSSVKAQILEEMTKNNVRKWETDNIILTKVEDTVQVSFDSKSFKNDNPELYKKYEKQINKRGYLKITLK